ncbi:MAG: polysaccharide biosynthesis/export family protein [Actinomycetota bacterium]
MSVNNLGRNTIRLAIVGFALMIACFAQDNAMASKTEPDSPSAADSAKGVKADVKASKPAAEPKSDDSVTYRIGVEDELGISVWHEPDLSTTAVVRPDGMITLPLLNDLKVTGMTTHELQDMLTEKLKDFVKEPQVTVIVRQIRSRRVYLFGEVARPGTYPLNTSMTVLQLLAEAGGPGTYAKLGSIYVIRQENGVRKRLAFHYKRALSGRSMSDDILLRPGDMVVVP